MNKKIAENLDNVDDNSKLPHSSKINVIKTLSNETRVSIFLYLLIYQKLSLDDLKKLLNKKAKSTIFHHIKILQDSGLVKEFGTKEGTKIKFFGIDEKRKENLVIGEDIDFSKKELEIDKSLLEYLKAGYEVFKSSYTIVDHSFNLTIDYQDKRIKEYEEKIEKEEIIKVKTTNLLETSLEFRFMTRKKFEIFEKEYTEFKLRLEEKYKAIEDIEDSEENYENEVVSFNLTIPIKKYIDEKYKEDVIKEE